MKTVLSFIVAAASYVALGVITWNIVCKNIEWQNYTIYDLALLRLTTYSVVTAIIICLGMLFEGSSGKDKWYCLLALLFTVFGNWAIGTLSEEVESFWSKISPLIAIFYNIVNISLISIVILLNISKEEDL